MERGPLGKDATRTVQFMAAAIAPKSASTLMAKLGALPQAEQLRFHRRVRRDPANGEVAVLLAPAEGTAPTAWPAVRAALGAAEGGAEALALLLRTFRVAVTASAPRGAEQCAAAEARWPVRGSSKGSAVAATNTKACAALRPAAEGV